MNVRTIARLLRLRETLRHRDRWSRRELESHQAATLRDLRDHAYAHSAFYRRFHAGLEARPLHELPILTKAELMEHFDELVTDRSIRLADVHAHVTGPTAGAPLHGKLRVASTSGTTGRRGLFVCNEREWATVLASYTRANDWAGVQAGLTKHLKLAVVSSRVPWHQSSLVGATLQSPLVEALRIDATEAVTAIVTRLNEFAPRSLVAYASMARLLAEEQLAGRLKIAPEAVMCASEVLTDESRRRIEEAWLVKPFNVYAATEPAGIASECELHQGLHLYEDLVITEVVDEQNRPVPPGVYGAKVLVTALWNFTQPLIRYEMSDRVALGHATCPCGRPFSMLAGIEGRAEDVLVLSGSQGERIHVHPNVFHRVLELLPLTAWQVVEEKNRLRVLLAGAGPGIDDAALSRDVANALAEQGVAPLNVHVERVVAIPRTTLGKAQLVQALKT